ncbi:MAG: radical SAM protein [Candidatus Glassbacteria bacterium]|nr:radical SAM protein [Candidatus Glassbacteria bacterium]
MGRGNSPRWLELHRSGELASRAERASGLAGDCRLCPRACHAARFRPGTHGLCGAVSPAEALVAASIPHFGEEPPVSGSRGSGTVFFGGCSLRCIFCQNHQISRLEDGCKIVRCDARELAGLFLELQRAGCHNLNLVTATPYLPSILEALGLAAADGFSLPIVYNSGGYESEETLELLESVVDIYLPDMKFGCPEQARLLCEAPEYVAVNRRAVAEMYRQAGLLELDSEGIATGGLIVRHLVLPSGLAATREVLEFIASRLSAEVHLSLMAQYYPAFRARELPGLGRPVSRREYREAELWLEEFGFTNGWVQQLEAEAHYRPDFSRGDPFSS